MGAALSETARLRLRASGRVQGVGFRWFVREAARRLDLAGWVRNEPDGSVLLEVEGPAAAISRLREAIARGPDGARVDAVESLSVGDGPLPRPFGVER